MAWEMCDKRYEVIITLEYRGLFYAGTSPLSGWKKKHTCILIGVNQGIFFLLLRGIFIHPPPQMKGISAYFLSSVGKKGLTAIEYTLPLSPYSTKLTILDALVHTYTSLRKYCAIKIGGILKKVVSERVWHKTSKQLGAHQEIRYCWYCILVKWLSQYIVVISSREFVKFFPLCHFMSGIVSSPHMIMIPHASIRYWRPLVTSAPVVLDVGSRVTTAHAHQYCIFQSDAKTVPSRMKLTMKLTMRDPASMTKDTWSWRVTSWLQQRIKESGNFEANKNILAD